jgi:SAM-dependent methyltransferase
VSISSSIKKYVPESLHPGLGRLKRAVTRSMSRPPTYEERVKAELTVFSATEKVHDLPAIAGYWSTKFLVPMIEPLGFRNSLEMFRLYIAQVCRQYPNEICRVLSIASGDSASEINTVEWLLEQQIRNFKLECWDINEEVLSRGRSAAAEKGIDQYFDFSVSDINLWEPQKQYHVILAVQCLHHVVELERLFDRIHQSLHPCGFFATDDMIGRNGHQRWPEAMHHVKHLWKDLPPSYKFSHASRTFDRKVDNRDWSEGSFEGIRSQDILPLLVRRFHFDVFAGFGNIVDVFIDRVYGPNFDPLKVWDREFIDRVHALDVQEIDAGRVKPTHMYAVMTRTAMAKPRFPRHWSPEFCVRHP